MSYTILSAQYANAESTAAVVQTMEAGAVLASAADTPELWAQLVAVQPFPAPALADYQKAARARIDGDVDRVFFDVVGDRTTEYQKANDDANAFKGSAYLGAVPASVQCWATVKGWTAQQACDDILATAAGWLNAQQSMRANRLARKQDVTAAADLAAVDAVLATWAGYIAGLRGQLGI